MLMDQNLRERERERESACVRERERERERENMNGEEKKILLLTKHINPVASTMQGSFLLNMQ